MENWVVGLTVRVVAAAAEATELPRILEVSNICRKLNRLFPKAVRSAQILRRRSGEPGLSAEPPYDDPAAAPAWCFMRLAVLAHEAATSPTWQPSGGRVLAIQALAASGLFSIPPV